MTVSGTGSDWSTIILKGNLSRNSANENQNNLLNVAKLLEKRYVPTFDVQLIIVLVFLNQLSCLLSFSDESFLSSVEEDFCPSLSIVLADFFVRNATEGQYRNFSCLFGDEFIVFLFHFQQTLDSVWSFQTAVK